MNTSRAEANNVSRTSDEKWYDVPISNSNDNEMDNIVIEKRGDTGKGENEKGGEKSNNNYAGDSVVSLMVFCLVLGIINEEDNK